MMSTLAFPDRRAFLVGAGAFTASFMIPIQVHSQQNLPPLITRSATLHPSMRAWLRIHADGTVAMMSGKVELGQGIKTALAQIVAEELDVGIDRIRVVSGDTAKTPDEAYTAGSLSIEQSGHALRLAAAEMRGHLLRLAAERLRAKSDDLRIEDGRVSGRGGSVTYWQLAGGREIDLPLQGQAKPKDPKTYRVVGQSLPRIDLPAKLTGAEAYVHDIRLPGMLHGRVVRPPRYGARLVQLDEAAAKAMPGVLHVVRDGSFVGVVAEREEQAITAAEAIANACRWAGGWTLPAQSRIFDLMTSGRVETTVHRNLGDVNGNAGARRFDATYRRPFQAHASIGPSCAIAQFDGDRLTVWTHSQGVFQLRGNLAAVLGMPVEKVRAIHREGSGCYGHNGADDVVMDAAYLARAAGRPVRVMWSRADEMAWSPAGTPMIARIRGDIGQDGRLLNYLHEVWTGAHADRPGFVEGSALLSSWYVQRAAPRGPIRDIPPLLLGGGERNSDPPYDIPNQRALKHFVADLPIRVSALRALGSYLNTFAMESFIDEVAVATGVDPVEYRLRQMSSPRNASVIRAAARAAEWGNAKTGDGRGRGFAYGRYKNSAGAMAVAVDVEVDRRNGTILVPRVLCAVEAGQVINPDGLRNQIEGGIIQSLSWTMLEELGFDANLISTTDWTSYPILPIGAAPREIRIELIDLPNERSVGAGETAQGPVAAALANAIFAATGARLRDIPFTPERVRTALG
jgi:nicotinate dehydrogenase subunit B